MFVRDPSWRRRSLLAAALFLAPSAGCGESTAPSLDSVRLDLQAVVTGLSNPIHLTAPSGDARLFVVEQPGRIRVVTSGQLLATPFLDISSKVNYGGERTWSVPNVGNVTSCGEDSAGELYVLSGSGTVYRIVRG